MPIGRDRNGYGDHSKNSGKDREWRSGGRNDGSAKSTDKEADRKIKQIKDSLSGDVDVNSYIPISDNNDISYSSSDHPGFENPIYFNPDYDS